jgi:DNA polymerase-1
MREGATINSVFFLAYFTYFYSVSRSKLVIIDGNAIIHRAYHAIPPLTRKDGVMVNAVYGFVSMLFKALNDLKPTHVAVTFDVAGGSYSRLEKFADYKGTRVKADQALYDQIPLTHEVVAGLGLAIFEQAGYEADDVIGTIAKQVEKKDNVDVFIVTGDMDTLQLVDDTIKVYTLRKGLSDIVIYDTAEVHKRYGFGPERVVDYKAIRGDESDNIPGVPGIGEKGATELIQKAGSLEEIYSKIESLKDLGIKDGVIKKLIAGKESAFMSKEIAAIDCKVPNLNFSLEKSRVKPFDREKIVSLFSQYEFTSLLKRLPETAGFVTEPEKKSSKRATHKDLIFTEVKNKKDVVEIKELIKNEGSFTARAVVSGDLFSGHISHLVVVVQHQAFALSSEAISAFLSVFSEEKYTLIGHDLKQLVKAVEQIGQTTVKNKLFDCMIASYLLNPGNRSNDPASIILKVVGKELPAGSGQESLFGTDVRVVAHELYLLAQASLELKKDLTDVENIGLFETLEMPLVKTLSAMELAGVAVDTAMLATISKNVATQVAKCTKTIYEEAGEEFNIASPIQLREVLFERMAIPTFGIKKGKTGLSTSADELEKLRGQHPIIDSILEFRELTKLQNTYIDVLPTLINKTTGRIHSTFNQAVAATGRLSSSDPNLQNIPIRTALGKEIRNTFIAEKGYALISADYSQIELRIVASLAKDAKMMAIFEKDEDIHQATAAAIHGVPLSEVTKDMRRSAKEVNFGVLYGMGAHGLSWRAQIPHAQAQAFITKYFEEFSGVRQYMDSTLAFTKKEGYCETLFGRRRYIPELNSSNYQLRGSAERMAINHPVQGTAADLMKMAMNKVYQEMSREYSTDEVKVTLQVHDELVLEVKEAIVDEVMPKVKKIMEEVVTLRVPVKVEIGAGKRWGEIK